MIEVTIVPESIQLLKMTDAEYFSAKYKDYISNSKLGTINPDEGGSTEKYEAGIKSAYSESFELGSAIHAMILQPDFYHIANIHKPTGKLGIWAEEVFKLRQQGFSIEQATLQASINADYYASKFSKNRLQTAIKNSIEFYIQRIKFEDVLDKQTIFLSAPTKNKYEQCMLGIAINSKIKELLSPTGLLSNPEIYNEYAILCTLEITNIDTGEIQKLLFKAKLDNFTINHETQTVVLNDLKSTGHPVKYFMGNKVQKTNEKGDEETVYYNGSFQKYHYYRQMGIYLWLLRSALHTLYGLDYSVKANIIAIETIPEYTSAVYGVSNTQIQYGLSEFKELITKVLQWI